MDEIIARFNVEKTGAYYGEMRFYNLSELFHFNANHPDLIQVGIKYIPVEG